LVYYQNIDETSAQESLIHYEVKLQPDDLLLIIVSCRDPESTAPFNLDQFLSKTPKRTIYGGGQQSNQMYLVDANGTIDFFPVLGKLKVGGLTRTEALKTLQDIGAYIKTNPSNLRYHEF
jgi:polysaccharide export outer membrane protein